MNIEELNNPLQNNDKNVDYPSYVYHTPYYATKIPNRNDKCPCGSGKKVKKCCKHLLNKEYYEK